MRRVLSWLLIASTAMALYAAGLGIRRHRVAVWSAGRERPFPFTLESALHFRRVRALYNGQALPIRDKDVQYPEGVRTFVSDTVGFEYVLAALARAGPRSVSLEDRLRWISAAWFCLGIPLMFAGVRRWTGSASAGGVAAAFYAVSLGAVIRSTGWELSRENFAFPFILAHLWADAGAEEAGRRGVARAALSALALAGALLCWDLAQFHLALWTIGRAAAWIRRPSARFDAAARRWFLPAAALAVVALLHPYYRTRGLLFSPFLLAPAAIAVASAASRRRAGRAPSSRAAALALLAAVAISAALRAGVFEESYGHFGELLWAKIRFLNRKPSDPALLTFAQRMLWTPALHSTTAPLAFGLFPWIIPLTSAAVVIALSHKFHGGSETFIPPFILFSHCASLLFFWLFFRFHVFFAVFSAAVMGAAFASLWRRRRAAVAAALVGEAANTARSTWAPARGETAYEALEDLADWLRQNARGAPVLAHFGTSAFALTYGGAPIVLHPKFESKEIRDRVEAYAAELFKGTERSFRDWADRYGAVLYVHGLGEFSPRSPEYQMRYMANALTPPAEAPVWNFEFHPLRCRRFRYVWGNEKYRVFRIVSRAEEDIADELARRAKAALEEGRIEDAELLAEQALRRFAGQEDAARVWRHARALRAAEFGETEPTP